MDIPNVIRQENVGSSFSSVNKSSVEQARAALDNAPIETSTRTWNPLTWFN